MAVVTGRPETTLEQPSTVAIAEERKVPAVKLWALLGTGFLLLQFYLYGRWILSGPKPSPGGPDVNPTWMKWSVHGVELMGVVCLPLFLYYFLYKPWRRNGHISVDGLLCLVFLTVYWQDTLLNYTQNWATLNTAIINWGSWNNFVPGWLAPHGERIAEAPVWLFPTYVYIVFGGSVAGCWVMRKAKQHWPQLGTLGMVAVLFGACCVLEIIMEPLVFLPLGIYAYPGSIKGLTLFYGTYHQFPVYEGVFWAGVWTAWACLRYFRNDKNQTLAERGAEKLRVAGWKKAGVRFLALCGICNVIYLGFYNIPLNLFSLHAGPFPADVREHRSYLLDGLCGPHTDYACPGDGVPIPKVGSSHLGPDGRLVVPAGVQLPNGSG